MVNVSRKKLSTKDYTRAQEQLVQLLDSLTKTSARYFISELLSETEQIMLTKRFAAILLRSDGHSPYRISKVVGISVSTAQRITQHHDDGQYNHFLSSFSKKQKNQFLTLIEDLIVAQASPKARARIIDGAAGS